MGAIDLLRPDLLSLSVVESVLVIRSTEIHHPVFGPVALAGFPVHVLGQPSQVWPTWQNQRRRDSRNQVTKEHGGVRCLSRRVLILEIKDSLSVLI